MGLWNLHAIEEVGTAMLPIESLVETEKVLGRCQGGVKGFDYTLEIME